MKGPIDIVDMVLSAIMWTLLLLAFQMLAEEAPAQTTGPQHLATWFQGEPVITEHQLIRPLVSSHAEVRLRMAELAQLTPEHFWEQPGNTTILGTQMVLPILERIDFEIEGIQSYALAYVYHRQPSANCAILIVPGSGPHQARQVMFGQGYHEDIVQQARRHCHVWVALRPFHDADALAFIHGGATVTWPTANGFLMPIGTTIETVWAIQLTAIALSLTERYGAYGLAGLSQGASFAAITATAVPPCLAVLASGYSAKERDLAGTWGLNAGILIPDIDELAPDIVNALDHDQIMLALNTDGPPDAFTYDAAIRGSCNMIDGATCVIGSHGHAFPRSPTRDHLSQFAPECM